MITWIIAAFMILILYLISNVGFKRLGKLWQIFQRDLITLQIFIKVSMGLRRFLKTKMTVAKLFMKNAEKFPDKIVIYFEDQTWTLKELDEYSNQIANYFNSIGLKKNDVVALMMESRPEYLAIWLGLSKLGVITALINSNLTSSSLVHSLEAANPKCLIYGAQFRQVLRNIYSKINSLKLYEFGEDNTDPDFCSNLNQTISSFSKNTDNIRREIEMVETNDSIFYIYTSGTTGLPKAAIITNGRAINMAMGMHYFGFLTEDDILYNPLPLYHSAGGVLGALQPLLYCTPMVLRRKFSASNFWSDCNKYNVTCPQYIGEMCRYVLAATSGKTVVNKTVKKMYGNGLKPDIWKEFVDRFKIDKVHEFYGATESNTALFNFEGKIGAVGFIPKLAKYIYPVCLIKYDEIAEEPIRDQNGFCIRCKVGEQGLLVGKIRKTIISNFVGYADKEATKKKILYNVFSKGDKYFNTGDLFIEDESNYLYFKDRVGDTYRWKGENISTNEVEAVISKILNYIDVAVYGVQIPGTEGRAGMATIVDEKNNLDLKYLYQSLQNHLPFYAIPIFLRLTSELDKTATFKMQKAKLKSDGFNVHQVQDKLYVMDKTLATYVPLTFDIYNNIINGRISM